ncbi:MAG: hypothetical protein WCG80_16455 [Spirochaetales bacterium]
MLNLTYTLELEPGHATSWLRPPRSVAAYAPTPLRGLGPADGKRVKTFVLDTNVSVGLIDFLVA